MKWAIALALLCHGCSQQQDPIADSSVPRVKQTGEPATHIVVWFAGRDRPVFGYVGDVQGQRVGIVEREEDVRLSSGLLKTLWVDLSSPTVERWELEAGAMRRLRHESERESFLRSLLQLSDTELRNRVMERWDERFPEDRQ